MCPLLLLALGAVAVYLCSDMSLVPGQVQSVGARSTIHLLFLHRSTDPSSFSAEEKKIEFSRAAFVFSRIPCDSVIRYVNDGGPDVPYVVSSLRLPFPRPRHDSPAPVG